MGTKFIKIAILVFCLGQLSSIVAQDSYEKPYDKIGRKPGLFRHYTLFSPTEKSAEKFDRLNTDFFFNSWLGNTNDVETKFYAIGHAINLMYDIPFGKKARMGIAIGLGYTHYNIRHDGDFEFKPNLTTPPSGSLNTTYSIINTYTGEDRWINRTVINQVDIPFELRFRSRKERGKVKFYPGFKIGYVFDTFEKWRIGKYEYKTFNFPDLDPIQYGATLRVGIDNLFLFGSYNLSYIFKHPSSNKLNLFSVGISFGLF